MSNASAVNALPYLTHLNEDLAYLDAKIDRCKSTQTVDAIIKDGNGNTIFEKKGVTAPSNWSQLSINIAAEKYFIKTGPDAESSIEEMCRRVAFEIASSGTDNDYFPDHHIGEKDTIEGKFYEVLTDLLKNQYFCFNSPVWFNVGVYDKPQISACYILGIEDNMESILEACKTEGMIYKLGSGSGINYSKLRGKGFPLSKGGVSSGVMSFVKMHDAIAGSIKSGGTTRRAAKMVLLDVNHPDIEEFIDSKTTEEQKAYALIKAGYDSDFRSDNGAYTTVAFQNANHSVRVTDKFMQGVVEGNADATRLFNKIATAAWQSGDPGLQFIDEINKWNSLKNSGTINGSNPCVTGDTLVATINGLVRIDSILDIHPNIGIIGLNGYDYECKPAFKTGHKPVYRLTTTAGYSLNLTGDHQVWTENRGDIKACELTKDDVVKLMPGAFGSINTSDDLMMLVGLALGDGCISKDNFQLTMNPFNELDVLQDAVRVLNSIKEVNPNTKESLINLTATTGKITSSAISVINELNKYAILDKYSEGKLIKDNVFMLSKSNIASLLRGLFTADGTVANYGNKSQYIALDSCALSLLQQVQLLLLQFGIKSKLYKNRRAGKTTSILPDGKDGLKEYNVLEMHSLRISKSSRVLFEKEIGFHSVSLKATALKELNQEVTTYKDSLTDTIESLEYIGLRDVYDLTEPNTNHFIANGIAVHNCSEYLSLDNTSCNLASINLMKFYIGDISKHNFDWDLFRAVCRFVTLCLDILISDASYPTKEITDNVLSYRQIGLGFANLGAWLMAVHHPYNSNEARCLAARITSTMTANAYIQSAYIANKLGAFPAYERNELPMFLVLNEGHHASVTGNNDLQDSDILEWDKVIELANDYGLRNSYVSNIAPTGTIGLVMGCDTTGIEPELGLIKYKKLVGGGVTKIVNASVEKALYSLDYGRIAVDDILSWIEDHGTLTGCSHVKPEHIAIFDTSFGDSNGEHTIDWHGHIDMMAAVQPFLSGAISKTVNMPKTATVEDVEAAYLYAWRKNLKCIAIYRDGCKNSQPMSTKKDTPKVEEITTLERKRLPDCRPSITHKFNISGHEGYLTVGLYENGQPGEIFVVISKEGTFVSGLLDAWATMVSIALQFGAPLGLLVDKLKGHTYDPQGITSNPDIRLAKSITDYIGRWLENKFVLNLKSSNEFSKKEQPKAKIDHWGNICPHCSGVMYQAGTCEVCSSCGETSGCS